MNNILDPKQKNIIEIKNKNEKKNTLRSHH